MGADDDKDFLNSDFPMYAAAGVATFVLYRAYARRFYGEPLQPPALAKGTFPPAFFTFVAAIACHEMHLDMSGRGGGLTAWSPAILAFLVASWVAHRAARAASGGELGVVSILFVIGVASLTISWLVADGVEPPQQLTKAEMRKAARQAAKAAKLAATNPTSKQLYLEKGNDVLTEKLHILLGVGVVVTLVIALVNGRGSWPRNLQKGSFPACFMIFVGVLACNSFIRSVRGFEGGCVDDFMPAIGAVLGASFLAQQGSRMQSDKGAPPI